MNKSETDAAPNQISLATEPRKRGRKRGSKGVDGRIADNNIISPSHSQHNSQYSDNVSLLSLKNQIDSMRGTTKKVKTTKELLAELQNRKITGVEAGGSNYSSQTSSPHFPVGYSSQRTQQNPLVPSPSTCSGMSNVILMIILPHFVIYI